MTSGGMTLVNGHSACRGIKKFKKVTGLWC